MNPLLAAGLTGLALDCHREGRVGAVGHVGLPAFNHAGCAIVLEQGPGLADRGDGAGVAAVAQGVDDLVAEPVDDEALIPG